MLECWNAGMLECWNAGMLDKILRASLCAMVFTSLAVLQSKLGFAACVTDNAQCEVSDGSNQFPGNMTFVPSGTGENNAAIIATNGSNIYGNNITINTPLNPNNYAGFVGASSYIYLTDSTINM